MIKINLLIATLEVLCFLINNKNVVKKDLRNYLDVDSDITENLLAALEANGLIKILNDTGELLIEEKGMNFIRKSETLIDPICVPARVQIK